jgi:hypothetical protein
VKAHILLDTNVWVQICDAGGRYDAMQLRKAASKANVTIVVVPPVVYELMARPTQDDESARSLRERAWVLSRRWWRRLLPDAYYESGELFKAIARYHPEWLRRDPDTEILAVLANDWLLPQQHIPIGLARRMSEAAGFDVPEAAIRSRVGAVIRSDGFWERLRLEPLEFAALMRARQVELDQVRSSMKDIRSQIASLRPANPRRPNEWTIGPGEIPYWRHYAAGSTRQLIEADLRSGLLGMRGLADWLEPVLDLRRVLRESDKWSHFWREEVTETEVPTFWLRGVAHAGQLSMAVSPGSPGDNQLVTYMGSVHYIATADKRLVDLIKLIGDFEPPVPVAKPLLLPQSAATLPTLIGMIDGSLPLSP